jgi:hypothetical protein
MVVNDVAVLSTPSELEERRRRDQENSPKNRTNNKAT